MKTPYGDTEDSPDEVWRIMRPTKWHGCGWAGAGEDEIIYTPYMQTSYPTKEAAEAELARIKRHYTKRSAEEGAEVDSWKIEPCMLYRLKKPFNPFVEKRRKSDEEE